MPAQTVIQLRRDTAANWTSTNPTLAAGEAGLETDSGLVKFGNGTLAWDALPYGSSASIRTRVLNQTGSPITKGSVVYISGASGDNPTITLADADTEVTSSKTLGLVDSTIANGAIGYVVEAGLITGLNTSTATAGQSVWLSSTAGQFVYGAPPAKPAHSVYLGVVIRAQTNNGAILVKVQNGYELNELHDVSIDGTPADNEVLAYNSATGMWINQTASEAGLAALSGATFTGAINGTDLTLSGDLTVNGTTTNINTQNLVVEDKNIIIGDVAVPSDTTADGGGITLKGATDKTFTWSDTTDAWTSSEDLNLATGKVYEINGTTVLSSSQVLGKSMPTGTVVGTSDTQELTNKTLSTGSAWQGNAVGAIYGGTGQTSYATGDILYSSATNTLAKLGVGSTGQVLTVAGGVPTWAAAPVSLPSQTGNAGELLVTDGTTASWSNTVTANSASSIGLAVRAASGQTARLQQWQDSAGSEVAYVSNTGIIGTTTDFIVSGLVGLGLNRTTAQQVLVGSTSSTRIGTTIRGAAAQTANLLELQDSASTVLASVSSAGVVTAPSFVPSSSTVPTNGMYLAGANTLGFATNSTARATFSSTGSLQLLGNLDVAAGIGGTTALIQIGNGRTADGIVYIDLVSDTTYTDFGTRMLRGSGANGSLAITNRGTGGISINSFEAGTVSFLTTNATRMTIAATGEVGIGASPITTDMLYVNTVSAANTGLLIQGVASQTGNLQEWQNSSGTILARVDSSGRFVGDGSQLTGIAAGESVSPLLLMGA